MQHFREPRTRAELETLLEDLDRLERIRGSGAVLGLTRATSTARGRRPSWRLAERREAPAYLLDADSALRARAAIVDVYRGPSGMAVAVSRAPAPLEGPFYAADRLVTAAEWAAAISSPA